VRLRQTEPNISLLTRVPDDHAKVSKRHLLRQARTLRTDEGRRSSIGNPPSTVTPPQLRYRVIEAARVETNGPPESGPLVIASSRQLD